ncbi:MAG: DNA polymerase III subunit delta' [Novosphingobium sp.]
MLSGHDAAWGEWRAAMASPRMHHAWILSGLAGLGKGAFARAAAAELVAEPGIHQPEPEHHPDVVIVDPLPATEADSERKQEGKPYHTKRSIGVDQVRLMRHRLETRPTLGSRRVVILDPADGLEPSAANALLKSLEEPPQGTFFLLVAHRMGRLLPTIRSRCRVLRFALLEEAEVARILGREAPEADAATRAAAAAAAEGSPGAALTFVGQELGALLPLMQRLVREGDPRFELRGALAEEIGARPQRERIAATLDLARAVLARELRGADRMGQAAIVEAYTALVRLTAQAPTYNFDPGLLAMEIGGLLASAAVPKAA